MVLKKILVPLDGSSLAEESLPAAVSLSRRIGASLCLLRVIGVANRDSSQAEAESYLLGMPGSMPDGDVCTHVVSGSAGDVIVETAASKGVDLIVMATRGRTGPARSLLGSVTDSVILNATMPVYVVRAGNSAEITYDDGVIVPLDGSEVAETALEHAATLAREFDSVVRLVRIVPSGADEAEAARARAYLEGAAARLEEQGIRAVAEIDSGDPGTVLVRTMSARPRCIVVLTTRGQSGLARWISGSVASELIRDASVPVVIVPPNEHALTGLAIH